jgi:hypothetical protein
VTAPGYARDRPVARPMQTPSREGRNGACNWYVRQNGPGSNAAMHERLREACLTTATAV